MRAHTHARMLTRARAHTHTRTAYNKKREKLWGSIRSSPGRGYHRSLNPFFSLVQRVPFYWISASFVEGENTLVSCAHNIAQQVYPLKLSGCALTADTEAGPGESGTMAHTSSFLARIVLSGSISITACRTNTMGCPSITLRKNVCTTYSTAKGTRR